MDDETRKKTLAAMTELVDASTELLVRTWETLSPEEQADLPADLRAKLEDLLARAEGAEQAT